MEIENSKINWFINHKKNAERKREKGGGKERNQNKSLNSERLKRRRLPLSVPAMVYLLNPSDNHLITSFQSQFSTYGILIPFISECWPFSSKKKESYLLFVFCQHSSVCAQLLSHVWPFAILWTIAHQVPLTMGLSQQEYWSGVPFPPPGDLPSSRIKPASLASPALADRFITTAPPDGQPKTERVFFPWRSVSGLCSPKVQEEALPSKRNSSHCNK